MLKHGGPHTPLGQKTSAKNLAKGPDKLVKHGAYRWINKTLAPNCDNCICRDLCDKYTPGANCAHAEAAYQETYDSVMALPHVSPHHHPIVRDYAKMVVALEIIDRYLTVIGMFVEKENGDFEVSGLIGQRDKWSTKVQALANDLGLSPAAESRLRLNREAGHMAELAKAFAELDRETDNETTTAIEGEFETIETAE